MKTTKKKKRGKKGGWFKGLTKPEKPKKEKPVKEEKGPEKELENVSSGNRVPIVRELKPGANALTVPQVTEGILLDYMAGPGGTHLTQIQKKLFIETAKSFNLHPLKREVYAIAYWNKETGTYDMSIITGYEVYLKRAERSGKLSGWKVWTEGMGNELKACINIWRKDFNEPVYHEVYAREYNTGRKIWVKKPITMIKKVAMAQGFRLAFPDELGGVPYTEAEGTEEPINITPDKKEKPKKGKVQEPGSAETPNPVAVPGDGRQAQELILLKTWTDMRKFDSVKFTKKYYDDAVSLVSKPGTETKDLEGTQITSLIGELEAGLKSEKEARKKRESEADAEDFDDVIPQEGTNGN